MNDGHSSEALQPAHAGPAHPQAPTWRGMIAPYLQPNPRRAIVQLLNTGLPFLAVMAAMLVGLHYGFLAILVLLPVGAMLLVRLFMFQHDCGHGSFFRSRSANDLLGRILGVVTLTPYSYWRDAHAVHHASTGNLDRRGIGDLTTLTVAEYASRSRFGRFAYRLYRHPLLLFFIGPIWMFLIWQRIPVGHPRRNWRNWLSIIGTDAAIAMMFAALLLIFGVKPVLLSLLPVAALGAMVGVWLFFVQHQFEDAYWEPRARWDFEAAALEGASYYDLPPILNWLTGNIGFHHVHHLASRIPNYRLRECHRSNPALQVAPRLTLLESLKCARLALWDTDRRKLVSFRDSRRAAHG